MKICLLAGLTALATILTGCSNLQSPCIIGERVTYTEDEVGNDMVWEVEDDMYYVRIATSNKVVVSMVEWNDEKETHTLESQEMIISELEDHMFLNVKEDDLYNIHYMIPAGDRSIVFYTIDGDGIKKLSPDRISETEKDSKIYLLKGTKEEIDQFVLEHAETLFDSSSPMVANLISGEL